MDYQRAGSALLILGIAIMSFKHGYEGLRSAIINKEIAMGQWGINRRTQIAINIITIFVGILILFPRTFLPGTTLGAIVFIVMMCFQLHAGDLKAALIEIPFLVINLWVLFLHHPLDHRVLRT